LVGGSPPCSVGLPGSRLRGATARYVYLLGLYLGDGCLSARPREVYKLRIALDAAYPNIVAEASDAIREVMPSNSVRTRLTRSNNYEVYSYSKCWPHLFPQHGVGHKHLRPIHLESWQQALADARPALLVRGLLQSDGCRFINTGRGGWKHPRYRFDNFSSDIRCIFCAACDQLGLHWTTAGTTIYVSRVRDVATLDRLVGPKA
jgi:hypothetical protein